MIFNGNGDNVTFDVIIGNPPYHQETNGGNRDNAYIPIYDKFVYGAESLNPSYIVLIIPSRFLSGGTKVLDKLRSRFIECKKVQQIHYYDRSHDIFKNADIMGGVLYYLYNRNYDTEMCEFYNHRIIEQNQETIDKVLSVSNRKLDEYSKENNKKIEYTIIADNIQNKIVSKVYSIINYNKLQSVSDYVLPVTPFGLLRNFVDSPEETEDKKIKVFCSKGEYTYTDINSIEKNRELVDTYKVIVGYNTNYAGADGEKQSNGNHKVLFSPMILEPGEVCTTSFIVVSCWRDKESAQNMLNYLKTKFSRALIASTISGLGLTERNFRFIPKINMQNTYSDDQLYKIFGLDTLIIDTETGQTAAQYIEQTITTME